MSSKKQISEFMAQNAVVEGVMVTRVINHADVKVNVDGKRYIVHYVRDNGNENFNLNGLGDMSDKAADILTDKVSKATECISTIPRNTDSTNKDFERKFYSNTEGNKNFLQALQPDGEEEIAYEMPLRDWKNLFRIVDTLPLSVQPIYMPFLQCRYHFHEEWTEFLDRLRDELLKMNKN
jgi:hypothetical protein